MSGHWWRRNWWGLLAVVPVLAVLVLISPEETYQTWRSAQPREALTPGEDGWVSYAGGRFRLVELAPADLRDVLDEPYPVPTGLRAWQATVIIEPERDPTRLLGCELQLEDEQGRLFGNAPAELADARLSDGELFFAHSCTAPDDDADAQQFENIALFVLPDGANPVALRVSLAEGLPAYVRFEVG